MRIGDYIVYETPDPKPEVTKPVNSTMRNIHLALWSAIAMILVLGTASIGAYKLLHSDPAPSCRGGVAHTYWGTTVTYANDDTGNEIGSSRFVSGVLCRNGTLIRPNG